MEKFKEMALLLDIYGELLTQKQRSVMEQYYSFDLSLQEIAENVGISKQGVHDLIRRAENTLVKTDEKLGFLNRLSIIQTGLEEVKCILEYLYREDIEHSSKKLEACLDKIENVINTCLGG